MKQPPATAPLFEDARTALDRIIRERGEDYTALSRLIGKNPAYIQQFIKRGTPRSLGERDRATLAEYLQIDEHLLGAPTTRSPRATDSMAVASTAAMVTVPRLDVGASAGAGGFAEGEGAQAHFAFDRGWIRQLGASPTQLALIRVQGDSMVPTLGDGDDIMVDAGDAIDRLRDGIYVLRRDGMLLVKRLARQISGGAARVAIISDNDAYPSDHNVPIDDLDVVGRVVWVGRRVG